MRGVVIHAPKDLRVDEVAVVAPGPGQVRVRIAAGGICGSDLHYYHHGGFGTVRIREPMALGHEIAGVIEEVGSNVDHLAPGTRVAVNPSRPCNVCRYCREGLHQHCLDMHFIGSAMRFPHAQGGFRQSLTIEAGQAVPIAEKMTMAEAAMAEPLAVCLHAARQAGPLMGRRVLVTGCGPIGALAVAVARLGGAAEIIATDIAAAPLQIRNARSRCRGLARRARALCGGQGRVRHPVRGLRQRGGFARRARRSASGRDRHPTRPRRRHDTAHEPDRREGTPAPRHVPL